MLDRRYKYDAFISYARLDDQCDFGKGWVSTLNKHLERALKDHLGRTPQIWRDVFFLKPTDNFEEKIFAALESTAVLIIVMSPAFVERDWFKKEYSKFLIACKEQGGVERRVFNVFKTETALDAMPDYLQKMLGYTFFVRDPENTKRGQSLTPESAREEYWSQLHDLVHDVTEQVRRLQAASPVEPPT